MLGIDRLIQPALHGKPVAYYVPTFPMLTEVWREVNHRLQPVVTRKNATEHRIELVTGGVIDFWSLDNPDGSRGRKYQRVVIDEAAHIRNLEEAKMKRYTKRVRPVSYNEATGTIEVAGGAIPQTVGGIVQPVTGWGEDTHLVATDGGYALAKLSAGEIIELPVVRRWQDAWEDDEMMLIGLGERIEA